MNNICIIKLEVIEEEVIIVVWIVEIYDFILSLLEGY